MTNNYRCKRLPDFQSPGLNISWPSLLLMKQTIQINSNRAASNSKETSYTLLQILAVEVPDRILMAAFTGL